MSAGSARGTLARLASAVGAIGTAIILIVFGPALADLPASIGAVPDWFTADPEQALVTVVAAVAWLCLLWLCLGVLLGVAAAIPGAAGRLSAALARLILPRAMRRLIEVGLGVTLVAGVGPVMAAMPAVAATHANPVTSASPATLPDLSRAAGLEFTIAPAALTADGATRPAQPAQPAQPTQPAQPASRAPDLDRPSAAGASPTVSVPGLGPSVPVVDLQPTASTPPAPAPPPPPATGRFSASPSSNRTSSPSTAARSRA
ncbi:hypothetical protein MXD60_23730, partial [Frankia sp. AgB32]|nr:hypothetical protein [Frankia sp. AgB32]